MFGGGKQGPLSILDAVGSDTIEFIEEHYIEEMGFSRKNAVDFLTKSCIDQGKLAAKSGKGGL